MPAPYPCVECGCKSCRCDFNPPGKPAPAALSAEMLGEEDVLRMLKLARMTIQTRRNIEDIEATITYPGTPRGNHHAKCVALCDDSLTTIDRLLGSADGKGGE